MKEYCQDETVNDELTNALYGLRNVLFLRFKSIHIYYSSPITRALQRPAKIIFHLTDV